MYSRRGSLRPRSKTTRTGRKRPVYSQQARKKKSVAMTERAAGYRQEARKLFYNTKANQAKWDKLATTWLKKPNRKSKTAKSKKGTKYTQNVYMQFQEYVISKKGNNWLTQILWKKWAKKHGYDKQTTAKKRPEKIPQSKRFKKLTKTEIAKLAKTYAKGTAKGRFGTLRKKVGLQNAQAVVAASRTTLINYKIPSTKKSTTSSQVKYKRSKMSNGNWAHYQVKNGKKKRISKADYQKKKKK